ncbi:glycine cleavage T C-terminal barrel domain-containing protein [Roseovarius sp. S1116L3]|uniref:glycine cleavage T C-terminal barrel domain-containing protein n=1 Tax=Roseovarius roseus TaxID=3342636 RepID=UPI00372C6B0B
MTFEITIGPNVRKSAYFDATVRDGVRSFSVYNHMYLPGHFGDPDGEYDRLLTGVSMWDVAGQRQVELMGRDAGRLAQILTPRNLSNTEIGQGRYVPLCDHDGWLINDPVLLKLAEDRYWLSVADSDIHLWALAIARERGLDVTVHEPDVSPMAIQGPLAVEVIADLFGDWVREMKHFAFRETMLGDIPLVLARSGWSKQGGYELYLTDRSRGTDLWMRVKEAGAPFDIGPGAPNDIERLESGLISYGADMRVQDYPATPYEMGFGPLIDLSVGHDFIGRAALEEQKKRGPARRRVGVFIEGVGEAARHPADLYLGSDVVGHVSEACHSRRLNRLIGVGLVRADITDETEDLKIALPDGLRRVQLTQLPFIA